MLFTSLRALQILQKLVVSKRLAEQSVPETVLLILMRASLLA